MKDSTNDYICLEMARYFSGRKVRLQVLTRKEIEAKLGKFSKPIFVDDVKADRNAISYVVKINNPEWIMNDHFSGINIIQCFSQGAQLLFYEHDKSFDSQENLFFLGGFKVKFLKPIFEGSLVRFKLNCDRFMQNVLLFGGSCVDGDGKAYARASGSLTSKKRTEVVVQKQ